MIETGLVYVHSTKPTKRFVGCGAVIEYSYVATCRHVWRMATEAAAKAHPNELLEVEIEYPGSWQDGATIRHKAVLAASCERSDGPAPDLVLLLPEAIPSGVEALRLALQEPFETGPGFVRAGFKGLDKSKPNDVQDVEIKGEIAALPRFDGRRQFTGANPMSYWSIPGASGSPVFRDGGQQLAGILSMSELGGKHEALVVPGTTIRRYLAELVASRARTTEGIDPARLRPILDTFGLSDVPVAEIPDRLKQFVDAARSRGAEPVQPSNDGADIDATVGASREKLRALDAAGARELLQAKIAEEKEARTRRFLPLLRERAEVERLTFDYEAAKTTLAEVTNLAPDDVWGWIGLGDLWWTTGPLERASDAYRGAQAAARRTGDERDLSVSHERIGDVLVAQGDAAGALTAYRAGLEIRETLARRDPANTEWQRDLSVSQNKIGDVLVAQGEREQALAAYRTGLEISKTLARRDPANTQWQRDLSVSQNKIGDVLVAQGSRAGARAGYRAGLEISETLARRDPANTQWQRDFSVSQSKIGDVLAAQGDRAGALAAYRAGLEISETLARHDPTDTQWQRDLSVIQNKIGDMLAAQGDGAGAIAAYRAGLEISETLARRDPANVEWQHDLSVSQNKIGDVLVVQGDRAGALAAFRAGLEISKTLARRDLCNTEWQRDLLVNHDRIGDMLAAQGDHAGALEAYLAGLEIRETLACRDPGNTEWQRDLIVSCWKISDTFLVRALDTARRLEAAGRLAPDDAWIPKELNRRLALTEK